MLLRKRNALVAKEVLTAALEQEGDAPLQTICPRRIRG
jgi:hypothetical protein